MATTEERPKLTTLNLTLHVDSEDKLWLERLAAEWVERRQAHCTIGLGPEEQPLEDLVSHLLYGVMEAITRPGSWEAAAMGPMLRYEDGSVPTPPNLEG